MGQWATDEERRMSEREPWEQPDDAESDDTTWRGDLHPESSLWRLSPYGAEAMWLPGEKEERDDALRELLNDAPIIDEPDEQC